MLDRGLELPVEAVEGLLQREARHHDAHRLVLLLLGRDSRERVIEEVGLAQSFFVALLEHPAQLGRRALQAQALAVRAQTHQLGRRHTARLLGNRRVDVEIADCRIRAGPVAQFIPGHPAVGGALPRGGKTPA